MGNNKVLTSLKEQITDACWEFGKLIMDRGEIFLDFEVFFEIVKEGPMAFSFYFDEEEWDDELYNCYIRLWELAEELYSDVDSGNQTEEEQVDDFIQQAIVDYIVC